MLFEIKFKKKQGIFKDLFIDQKFSMLKLLYIMQQYAINIWKIFKFLATLLLEL